jgi:chromosome segregation ATPase
VLVRYEEDYEILSQEKEQLNSQLLNAQTEIESLREEKNKVEQVGRLQDDEENFAKKSDTSEEMLDSSCFVGEPSISTSVIDMMEQSCESDDQFLSLRDQFTDTRGSSGSTEISEAAAQRKEKVEHSNKIKQLEEELVQLTERLELLQQDVEEKTSALEEKQRSIEAAQSTIEVLEQDGERQNLLSILDKLNEKMRLLSEDSNLVTKELETTRQTLEEIRAEARALFVAKELLESRLEKANEELEAARTGFDSVDRVAPPSQVDQEANARYEKTLEDLNLAHDRVKALESELEVKTTELNAALNAIQQAR